MTDFGAINAAALAQCPDLLETLLPGGRVCGREYVCGNLGGGPGQSCRVNMTSGRWADFAAGAAGGDIVALLAAIEGIGQGEAARRLAEMTGRDELLPKPSGRAAAPGPREKPAPILPVPEGVRPPAEIRHRERGKPDETFAYLNQEGRLLGFVCRFNKQELNGKGKPEKDFPIFLYTNKGWRWQGFPAPWPFFGLETLKDLPGDAPLVVVEGEGKALALREALEGARLAVLGLYGGCRKVEGMDYAPLAGRRVIYWPDNDQPGFGAALKFAGKARGGASSLKIIEPPADAPETWDCGDAVKKDGWDRKRLIDFIATRRLDPEAFGRLAQKRFGPGEAPEKPKAAAKPALRCLDIEEILSLQLPEREMLLDPILPRQGLAMVFAPRGLGKTFFSLAVAHAVASGGGLFGGWRAPKPCPVLFVDGELPLRTLQERLASIIGGSKSDITNSRNLRILTPDYQEGPMPDIATAEGQAAIEPLLAESDLVILDNLSCLARSGRSNEQEFWTPIQDWLLNLRRRGKSVLIVHHAGKNGDQRGTSAKEDILDTVISLRRPSDYRMEEGCRFEIHLTKARGICGEAAKPIEAKLDNIEGRLVWTAKDLEDADLERVRALLEDGLSVRDIAEETGLSKSTVGRMKKKIEAGS